MQRCNSCVHLCGSGRSYILHLVCKRYWMERYKFYTCHYTDSRNRKRHSICNGKQCLRIKCAVCIYCKLKCSAGSCYEYISTKSDLLRSICNTKHTDRARCYQLQLVCERYRMERLKHNEQYHTDSGYRTFEYICKRCERMRCGSVVLTEQCACGDHSSGVIYSK